jgi:heptosyltransferase-2
MTHSILIIGPAWIGDMVMAQSLFKVLKTQFPNVLIDVLAPEWTFSLLKCMREVNQAIPIPIGHGQLHLSTRYRLAKQLQQENRYEQAIVMQNSFKSALVPWLANIPKRTGWIGECRYFLLNDVRRLDKTTYPRMIEQFVALGLEKNAKLPASLPYPEFVISSAAKAETFATFKLKRSTQPILGLGVGAAFGPSKRWPIHYFGEIAQQKIAEGWQVWLFGSEQDRALTNIVMNMSKHQCIDFSGKTLLNQTLDLLSCTSGVVTNDSGLMHMAAALNKPLIVVYGSTSPTFTPPLSTQATILKLNLDCQPCFQRLCPLKHHECMMNISPAMVLSAMQAWGD